MKQNFLIILLASILLSACGNHLDVHMQYHDGEQKTYLQQVDTCYAATGYNRIILTLRYKNISQFTKSVVFYNNQKDSTVIDFSNTKIEGDSIVQEIMLPEGNYDLEIINYNSFNQKSIATDLFVSTYGDNYRTSLNNRVMKDANYQSFDIADGFNINWSITPNQYAFTEIKYNDQTVRIGTENNIQIPNCRPTGDSFVYRTAYLPEATAIDTFYTDWSSPIAIQPKSEFLGFDRSLWKAIAVSDETASDGGGKDAVIDGDRNTFWHSMWDNGNAPLPHWVIIDMNETYDIEDIHTFRRQNSSDTKAGYYEICSDYDIDSNTGNWQRVGSVLFSTTASISDHKLNLETPSSGRFLKLTLTESNRNPFTNIAEIIPGKTVQKYPQ